jgi:hypothetical protein
MAANTYELLSAPELEESLGPKYFYRQKIYRLAEGQRIRRYRFREQTCFMSSEVVKAFLEDLERALTVQHPDIDHAKIEILYDPDARRVVVDGLFEKGVAVDAVKETQEDLLSKVAHIKEWTSGVTYSGESSGDSGGVTPQAQEVTPDESLVPSTLPTELAWVKLDVGEIKGVEVKSLILISLPSLAQFVGLRTDSFSRWVATSTFADSVLSAHYRHFQSQADSEHPPAQLTQDGGSWRKGFAPGYVSLLPLEVVPELLVAIRQSQFRPRFPQKAEMLYRIAKTALEAVGLALGGDKARAADELALVGQGLGLSEADQIIAIFRQHANRDFQIKTNKEFRGKVKAVKADYAITTGKITLGVTGRTAADWQTIGSSKNLPAKYRTTGREVMRQVSPADSVGLTFAESHYIKVPEVAEAIETGKQGKSFYQRLKDVGLLEDAKPDDRPVELEVRGEVE